MNYKREKEGFVVSFSLLFFISIFGCGVSKNNYSYKLTNYLISNNQMEELPFKSHLISFNGYLFEFKLDLRQNDTIYAKTGKINRNENYDTSGVYILNLENRRFIEFDSFSVRGKIIKSGKFSKKEFGIKLSDSLLKEVPFFKNKTLKDTFLWGKKLYYIDTVEKGRLFKDSILTHVFFIKDRSFVSMYELNTGVFPDAEYSMVGYSTFFIEQKIFGVGLLEDMRKLTRSEDKICAYMIEETKVLKNE